MTARVADETSRVASSQQAISRLRQLYRSAGKVSDVIVVESELSGRERDLEALPFLALTLVLAVAGRLL